jgi:hypothetical protein
MHDKNNQEGTSRAKWAFAIVIIAIYAGFIIYGCLLPPTESTVSKEKIRALEQTVVSYKGLIEEMKEKERSLISDCNWQLIILERYVREAFPDTELPAWFSWRFHQP